MTAESDCRGSDPSARQGWASPVFPLDPLRDAMARQGEVIENPVTGERIEFRETARETGGEALVFDYYLAPGGFAVGKYDHVHPRQEERIEVESGRLGVRIEGDEWTATPGTRFAVPPETAHTVWNDGDETMHAVVSLEPALDSETFFEEMFALASARTTNALGLPGPLRLAVLAGAYREEIAAAGLPRPLQRAAASALAPVGRALGYRADPRREDAHR